MRETTVCFTGHRDIPDTDRDAVTARLKRCLMGLANEGYDTFCAGGALGFDTLAAETVLALKTVCPQVKLHLVLPCKNQTRGWPSEAVAQYEEILSKADVVTYTAETYHRGCMHLRNRRLVDESSVCVCYLKKPTGGTAYTVDYARKNGLRLFNTAFEK